MSDKPYLKMAAQGTTHATPGLVELLDGLFHAKTTADGDAMGEYFSREKTTYIDVVMGWRFPDWENFRAAGAELMPNWGEGSRSYATRIIGDKNSAIVFMVDSEEMFGAEIRSISPINFENGKIVRWVDYWSGLSWPREHRAQLSVPADQFPTDLAEHTVTVVATPLIQRTAYGLSSAFAAADPIAAEVLLSSDVELDDLALNIHLAGRRAVQGFLQRALPLLPYGSGSTVRHIVGGDAGGGYEWTAGRSTARPDLRGVTALELDPAGRVSRLTSVWDASSFTRKELVTMYQQTFTDTGSFG